MESSAGTVVPPLEAQPSQRPGWLWTVAWVIFGAIVSGILVRLGLAGMTSLHLFPGEASEGWPWEVDGAWTLAADLGYGLLHGFALAWAMRVAVRGRRDGWDLRLWPVAGAMALATASDTTISGLTGFALIVVAVHELALRPAGATRPHSGVSTAIAAGVAALLVATFSYQPLHPLLAAFPNRDNQLMSSTVDPMPPDSARQLSFAVENAGVGTATVRSVRLVGPNASLLDVIGHRGSLVGARLARDERYAGRIVLSKAACTFDAARYRMPSASVDALVVRVETLGTVRTQRLDVDPSADLFCGLPAFNR